MCTDVDTVCESTDNKSAGCLSAISFTSFSHRYFVVKSLALRTYDAECLGDSRSALPLINISNGASSQLASREGYSGSSIKRAVMSWR